MFNSNAIRLLDFVISITGAIDHIDVRIANHNKRVAYIASQLAREMRMPLKRQHDLMIAGLLHDIGILSVRELNFFLQYDDSAINSWHGEAGYQLLNKFRHFKDVADIIRHHHTEYQNHKGDGEAEGVPSESILLYLADRIDVLIDKKQPILEQVDRIAAAIVHDSGTRFDPEHVDAFLELAWRETFWLDVVSPSLESVLLNNCRHYTVELDNDDLLDFAELLSHIIDFRCPFTATHSSGVANVAAVLANLFGFSETECQKVRVAGYLHDIGKLAIPIELLEKAGKLSSSEFRTIKSHSYYTYRILEPLQGMEDIRTWASMHHERLDGNGYPGRCAAFAIPLGARIIAAADVFTALLESRPYREKLGKAEVVELLAEKAQREILDRKVIDMLLQNFDAIDIYRSHAQEVARQEYLAFHDAIRAEKNISSAGRSMRLFGRAT